MNKILISIIILALLTASCIVLVLPALAASENTWAEKALMQEPRSSFGIAVVDGKIYAIGGDRGSTFSPYDVEVGTGLVVGINEEYDPATDTWVFKASMPTPRKYFAIAIHENKIYCIGGIGNNFTTTVNEVYDPATDTWQTKAPMPTARIYLQANVVDNKIYLISGGNDSGLLNATEVYDPLTDSWTEKAPIPVAVWGYASAVADDKIYIMGGISQSGTLYSSNKSNQIYDPKADSWSFGAPVPDMWFYATAAATSGVFAPEKIYVFDWQAKNSTTRVYDPLSDNWSVGASMPKARGYAGAAVINDTIYVIGGITTPDLTFTYPSAINEQYTPIMYGMNSPSLIPSQTPVLTPTASAINPSPSPLPTIPEMNLIAALIVIAAITCFVVVLRKK